MKEQFLNLSGLTDLVTYMKLCIAQHKVIIPRASFSLFPETGDENNIYIDTSTNAIYRWNDTDKKFVLLAKPPRTIAISEGTNNGEITLKVDNIASNAKVHGLTSTAFTESNKFATAAQGAKADSAVQTITLSSGTKNGTIKIKVNNITTDNIEVAGLGSAAFSDIGIFAAKSHTHKKDEVGLGNVDNTADIDKSVKYATSAGAVSWKNITDKPTLFPPTDHNHDSLYYRKNEVDSLLSGKSDTGHTHVQFIQETKFSNGTYSDPLNDTAVAIKASGGIASDLIYEGGKTLADKYQAKGSYAAANHSHNYAGSSESGGAAYNATNLLNSTPTLSIGCENNEISIKTNDNGLLNNFIGGDYASIRSALDFRWYDSHWQIGNIRSENRESYGFGFAFSPDGINYTKLVYIDVNGYIHGNLDGYATTANSVPWSGVTGKPSSYPPSSHTHSSVTDIGNGSTTTFAYSKSGLGYGDFTWLAAWNGHELRAVNKSLFAQASHSHTVSQISDFGTHVYDATISRTANTVLAAPNGKAGSASFRALVAADIPSITKSKITDFPSALPASDVYAWAKASSKPSYSWSEITGKPSTFAPSSHTHNYAGSSSAGGSANWANGASYSNYATKLETNPTEDKTKDGVYFFQKPNDSTMMPDTGWWSLIRTQHPGYSNGYWQEVAYSFGSDTVKFRRNVNGTKTGWRTFAWSDHTHNYAGSSSAGGSATSAIKVVDYGNTSQYISIGYGGSGISGDNIKFIAGYTTGSDGVVSRIKDVSKDALKSWIGSLPASDVYSWAKASSKPSYSWSEITSKPSTFTPASHTHDYITSSYRLTAGTTANRASGIRQYEIYDNGYPFTYGNVLQLTGSNGVSQIAMQWHGTGLAYRSAPDTSTTFSGWATILTSSNYTSYTVTKTGGGASGTWGINVTGSAGSVAWGNVSGRPSSLPASDVYSWAKASTKPSYSYTEITNRPTLIKAVSKNGYWGMADHDGSDSNWIRTTTVGIIPYQSGGAGGGHCGLGTSSWYFSSAYIDTVNCVNTNASGYLQANGLINTYSEYQSQKGSRDWRFGSATGSGDQNWFGFYDYTYGYHGGIYGPGHSLRMGGEIQSTAANGFRAVQGKYGFIIRNDGANVYFMMTGNGDPWGGWNDNYTIFTPNGEWQVKKSPYDNGMSTARGYVVLSDSNDNRVYSISNYNANYLKVRCGLNTYHCTYSNSDIRLKKNINNTSITNALSVINSIKVRQFDWKETNIHQSIGFVADELEKLDPNFSQGGGVTKDGGIDVKSVNSFYLQGYIVKALQELSSQVSDLKQENKRLKQKLNMCN